MRALLNILLLLLFLPAAGQSVRIKITTNMGVMRGYLYDETPKHRDEFVRLAKAGHFNGTLFYRVVKNFVIQGGSSDSRNAKPGQRIGYGDGSVNIDSEFSKKRFHKLGAICAPRQPDKINVFKISDISQFYIVRGQVYADSILTLMEKAVNNPIKKRIREIYYLPRKAELQQLKQTDPKAYNKLVTEIKETMEMEYKLSAYKEFTPEQREAYTTIGGCPELDDEYTVFGEITEGLEVLKKINSLKTDKNERPLQDVRIKVEIE